MTVKCIAYYNERSKRIKVTWAPRTNPLTTHKHKQYVLWMRYEHTWFR